MKDAILMIEKIRKRHLLLIIISLMVLVLYLGIEYVSEVQKNGGGYYTHQLSMQPETVDELTKINSEKSVLQVNISLQNIQTKNVSVAEEEEYTITVSNDDIEDFENFSKVTKNVFSEMKDIKKGGKNIFFIESSCVTEKSKKIFDVNNGFVLNARQCCSIESTALSNLDHEVYIFHSCPLTEDFIDHSPEFVKKLLVYPNVHVVRLNSAEIFMGSPVQDIYEKRLLENSAYPVEHASDLLRLVLMWRFGGTYCDLDVVALRSLNGLKTNWGGIQDDTTICNGILNFEAEGVGHTMLQLALEHANKHYDGANWSTNGPLLITPIIIKECKASSVLDAVKQCHVNFTVFDKHVLYPIYYLAAGQFFDDGLGRQIVEQVKARGSYSVHMWNKMSHNIQGRVGSTQAYALLADEFCPDVYRNCGLYF